MIKLLWAMLGTLGFGIIFNVNKDKLLPVMIGGFLNYLAYYITFKLTNNIFLSSALCAVTTSLYFGVTILLIFSVFVIPSNKISCSRNLFVSAITTE